MIKKALLLLGMLITWNNSFAIENDECKILLLNYLNKIHGFSKPVKNQAYYLRMSTTTEFNPDLKKKDVNVEVQIIRTKDKTYMESDYMCIYSDPKDAFVVVEPQQTILWRKTDPIVTQRETQNYKKISDLQDSLIRHGSIISCSQDKSANRGLLKIEMKPSNEIRARYLLNRSVYFLDARSGNIKKAVNFFDEGAKKRTETVVYQDMNLNYKGNVQPAYKMIFASNGKLNSKYKNYKLIDNRNKDN